MKRTHFFICTAIITFGMMVSSSIVAYAQSGLGLYVIFGGTFDGEMEVCCNGFTVGVDATTQTGGGTYLIWWQAIGTSFKQWYMPLEGNNTLGQAISGGQCITIESECESTEDVDYSLYGFDGSSMGTSITPSESN